MGRCIINLVETPFVHVPFILNLPMPLTVLPPTPHCTAARVDTAADVQYALLHARAEIRAKRSEERTITHHTSHIHHTCREY